MTSASARVLCVDVGSTFTKAVLVDTTTGQPQHWVDRCVSATEAGVDDVWEYL